jgi:heat shock protein HslJ
MKKIALLIFGMMLIVSCGSDKKDPTDLINNINWNVEHIGTISTFERTPMFKIQIEHNKIEGSTGCNRFFGNIKLEGYNITVQNIGSTKMACKDMQVETAFLQALNNMTNFEIEEDKLHLLSKDNKVLMRLTKSSD